MATTTPSGLTRVPTTGDEPDVPADMMRLAVDLEGQTSKLAAVFEEPIEMETRGALSGTQAISQATWTKLVWGGVVYSHSSGALVSTSSGVQITQSGRYFVEGAWVVPSTAGAGRRGIGIGQTSLAQPLRWAQDMRYFSWPDEQQLTISRSISAVAGDVITLWVWQQTGATINALKSEFWLCVRRLRVAVAS